MIVPRALRPGDTVAIIAPSGPFEPALAWRGLGFLATRYRLRFDRGMFSRAGYLAGDDARRREELAAALYAPDVAAVLAARGGYGASRVAHDLDWDRFRAHPKWIVGFSDITVLHVEAARAGVASLHASHVTILGRGDAKARADFISALEAPLAPRAFGDLRVIVPGEAEGQLFGGNLTLLHACAAAGRLVVPEGAIVFFEDVTEQPYRIDRMLTTLIVGGHLRRASAIVVGDFTSCEPGPDRVTARAVVEERTRSLGIPIVDGIPCGHGRRNDPLVLGVRARLRASGEKGALEVASIAR